MKRGYGIFLLLGAAAGYAATPAPDVESIESLVFGSFSSPENAANWAARVSHLLNTPIEVELLRNAEGVWYRVVTAHTSETTLNAVRRAADSHKLTYWRLTRLPGSVEETLPAKSKPPPPGPIAGPCRSR